MKNAKNIRNKKKPDFSFKDKSEPAGKHILWKLPWLLLIPLGIFLPKLAALAPDFIERVFSRAVYPVISAILSFVSSLLPFSLAEILLYALAIALAVIIVLILVRLFTGKLKLRLCLDRFISLLVFIGIMLNLFYFCWGFNYHRLTLDTLLELDVKERSAKELYNACSLLIDEANAVRPLVSVDANGVFALTDGELKTALFDVTKAYEKLGSEYKLFSQNVHSAKPILASKQLSAMGIAGIYIPFTAEANINVNQPALYTLSGAAHETAHYLGIARENEANFVAFLACRESDNPNVKYSGIMSVFTNCLNRLADADSELFNDICSRYCEGISLDYENYRVYYDKYNTQTRTNAQNFNDNYLKYNDQESGVKSYGEVVDLALAYFDKNS